MINHDDRQKLRDAALAAVNGTRARSDARRAAPAADWTLQTSNSFRRIGTLYGDGDVLCGTKHPIDAHPDLLAAAGVLDYIVAAQPRVVIQLLDDVDALEDKLHKAEIICGKIADVDARLDQMSDVLVALRSAVRQIADATDAEAVARARSLIDQLVTSLWAVRS